MNILAPLVGYKLVLTYFTGSFAKLFWVSFINIWTGFDRCLFHHDGNLQLRQVFINFNWRQFLWLWHPNNFIPFREILRKLFMLMTPVCLSTCTTTGSWLVGSSYKSIFDSVVNNIFFMSSFSMILVLFVFIMNPHETDYNQLGFLFCLFSGKSHDNDGTN